LTDWYRDGAAAEYVAVEARNLAPKPPALDHAMAAAVPMVALTAMQALFVHGRLERGQRVLVLGAGGGVGSFALQLARAAGAHAIAAARGWARDLAFELGAEQFVDVEEGGVEGAVRDADLVFDLVGGDALARASAALKAGGAVVSAVEPPPPTGGAAARRVFFVVEPNREQLAAVGARMAAGELRPIVGGTWPLSEGRTAFAAKQRGRLAGKAVLRVENDDGGARSP
jgi:NADPH:quinone reductase-like Zn-dependent oxidoreductase